MTMLIEVGRGDSTVVLSLYEGVEPQLSLPATVNASTWKEEIYFRFPLKLDGAPSPSYRVSKGKVYYWEPGQALCLFYGISQIYTPGYEVGRVIGPPRKLIEPLRDAGELSVAPHEPPAELKGLADRIKGELGVEVAAPIYDGQRVLAVGEGPVAAVVYVEDYGFHVESEPLFKYNTDYQTLSAVSRVKRLLEGSKYLRVDIDEDWNVVITAGVGGEDELVESLREFMDRIIQVYKEEGLGL